MNIIYTPDLEKQTFFESGEVLASANILASPAKPNSWFKLGAIDHPVVAFDMPGLAVLPNGRLISALFSADELPVTIEYDGTGNTWYKLEGTWPASIDTLTHLTGQNRSEILKTAEDVLDLACGTGMAGIYAANKNSNIKTLDFSDINPNATQSAMRNLVSSYQASPNGLVRMAEGYVGDGFNLGSGNKYRKYDAIIASAIPATPAYPELERPLNPLFEGTQLLEDILREAPEHLNDGGKLILSHSSVGEVEFQELAEKYGAKVDRVLAERENSFRVEFLEDPSWVEYLVQQGGMTARNERGHTHWHKSLVKEISF